MRYKGKTKGEDVKDEGNVEVGKYLKKLRLLAGLTQEEAAQKSNVSVPYISLLERGSKSKPSFSILERLSKAYDADLRQMLIQTGHQTIPEEVLAELETEFPEEGRSGQNRKESEAIKQVKEVDFKEEVAESRLNWAVETIYRDPDFKTATTLPPQELPASTKKLIVEMYQQATGRRLLTRQDNLITAIDKEVTKETDEKEEEG